MSFEQLKANRAQSISRLTLAAEKLNTSKSYEADDRFWTPTIDKAGNGFAILRFLPAPAGDDLPWVRYWDHGFKGNTGRWYIENSLTSIGQNDPVSEMNTKLWNSGREEDKDTVRQRKRRLHYVSNIMVIADPGNPANEGKVFLFKYGKKIFDKINDIMQPQFQDEQPVNPYDFWSGASFKVKIRQVEGYRNYDKSEFEKSSALFNGDELRLKEIYDGLFPLKEFIDPKQYKSYAELSTKLRQVLGDDSSPMASAESVEIRPFQTAPAPAPGPKADSSDELEMDYKKPAAYGREDEDDTLSYFAKLARP